MNQGSRFGWVFEWVAAAVILLLVAVAVWVVMGKKRSEPYEPFDPQPHQTTLWLQQQIPPHASRAWVKRWLKRHMQYHALWPTEMEDYWSSPTKQTATQAGVKTAIIAEVPYTMTDAVFFFDAGDKLMKWDLENTTSENDP